MSIPILSRQSSRLALSGSILQPGYQCRFQLRERLVFTFRAIRLEILGPALVRLYPPRSHRDEFLMEANGTLPV